MCCRLTDCAYGLKVRGAAAQSRGSPFSTERPPRPDSFKRWLANNAFQTVEEPYACQVDDAREHAKPIREAGSPPAHGAITGLIAIVPAVLKAELKNHAE